MSRFFDPFAMPSDAVREMQRRSPMAHVPVPVMTPRPQAIAKPSLQAKVAERLGMSLDSSDAEVLAELDSRMKPQAADKPAPFATLTPAAAETERAALAVLAWVEGESPDDGRSLLSSADRELYERAFGTD